MSPSPFANNVFPIAIAEKFGNGLWSAYVCPQFTLPPPQGSMRNEESAIQANISDGSAYTVSCLDNPPTGAVTGIVSASSLAGSAFVEIIGAQGSFIVSEIRARNRYPGDLHKGHSDGRVWKADSDPPPLGCRFSTPSGSQVRLTVALP